MVRDHRECAADPARGRLTWKSIALILLYGVTALGIRLGGTRVLTHHEVVFAEPAREMLRGGDWIVPPFVGVPSTHKPPLTHWLIATSMAAFGSRAEWVCRLPIVLAALAAAVMMAALGARWYGERVGAISALLQLTTFYVLMQARLAEADMLLCMTVSGAMLCFALANIPPRETERPPRYLAWLFFAFCGVSFMTKFLIGPAFILGGCALYVLVQRQWRTFRFLLSPIGWLIFVAVVLPWPLAAYRQYPQILADWRMHNFGRFMGQMKSPNRPWFFYFYMAPALMVPWTPWLLGALWAGRKERLWSTPQWRFAAAWLLAGLVVLTPSAWKHKHYLIPVLPPLSIITGWYLARGAFGRTGLRVRPVLAAGLIALGCGSGIAAVWLIRPAIAWPAAGILTLCGVLFSLAAVLDHRRKPTAALAAIFAAFWIVAVGVQSLIIRHFDSYRDQTELARRVNGLAPNDVPLYLVHLPENQITYYLRFPLERFDQVEAFAAHVKAGHGQDFYVLAPHAIVDTMKRLGRVTVLDRCATIRKGMQEGERLTFLRLQRTR